MLLRYYIELAWIIYSQRALRQRELTLYSTIQFRFQEKEGGEGGKKKKKNPGKS